MTHKTMTHKHTIILAGITSTILAVTSQASVILLADSAPNSGSPTPQQSFNATASGFSASVTSGTTTITEALTLTTNSIARFQVSDATGATVSYNFSSVDNVDGFLFWNYYETNQQSDSVRSRGLDSATVTVNHNGGSTAFNLTSFAEEAANPTGADAEQISFGSTFDGVTSIEFTNIVDTDASGFVGWSGFMATTAVPEPSSTLLLGLGSLGLIMRRRRNS